jgi:hypothetical protein
MSRFLVIAQSYDDDKVCVDRAKVAFKCVEPDISENR